MLPDRLVLSPDGTGGWTLAARPRSGASGRVELWHARLGTKAAALDGGVDEATRPPVRAVWSPDYAPPGGPVPDGSATDTWGRSSLRPNWRPQIVRLTSDGTLTVGVDILLLHVDVPVPPVPIEVSRLHLTALGGSLASRFVWTVGPGVLPVQDPGGISPLPDGLNVSEGGTRRPWVATTTSGWSSRARCGRRATAPRWSRSASGSSSLPGRADRRRPAAAQLRDRP